MKKVILGILKWGFLVLFVAAMISGFLLARKFERQLQSLNFQERTFAL